MFGQSMKVVVDYKDGLIIHLTSFSREEATTLIEDGGLSHHSVSCYTANNRAYTLDDLLERYETIRKLNDSWTWGIWVETGDQRKLIGYTQIFDLETHPIRQATSRVAIANKLYWGGGIASAVIRARTWYAFNQLNLVRIRSSVMEPNTGSIKALTSTGYSKLCTERNVAFVNGDYIHRLRFECLNPSSLAWLTWWNKDEPPDEAIYAKKVTLETLEWANRQVTLL